MQTKFKAVAKQVVKKRRRRRVVEREKIMQNSPDRRDINQLQSSNYKQKLHKRHLRRSHSQKQQCGKLTKFTDYFLSFDSHRPLE